MMFYGCYCKIAGRDQKWYHCGYYAQFASYNPFGCSQHNQQTPHQTDAQHIHTHHVVNTHYNQLPSINQICPESVKHWTIKMKPEIHHNCLMTVNQSWIDQRLHLEHQVVLFEGKTIQKVVIWNMMMSSRWWTCWTFFAQPCKISDHINPLE